MITDEMRSMIGPTFAILFKVSPQDNGEELFLTSNHYPLASGGSTYLPAEINCDLSTLADRHASLEVHISRSIIETLLARRLDHNGRRLPPPQVSLHVARLDNPEDTIPLMEMVLLSIQPLENRVYLGPAHPPKLGNFQPPVGFPAPSHNRG